MDDSDDEGWTEVNYRKNKEKTTEPRWRPSRDETRWHYEHKRDNRRGDTPPRSYAQAATRRPESRPGPGAGLRSRADRYASPDHHYRRRPASPAHRADRGRGPFSRERKEPRWDRERDRDRHPTSYGPRGNYTTTKHDHRDRDRGRSRDRNRSRDRHGDRETYRDKNKQQQKRKRDRDEDRDSDKRSGYIESDDPNFTAKVKAIYQIIKAKHHLHNVSTEAAPPYIHRTARNLATLIRPAAPTKRTSEMLTGNAHNWEYTTLLILREHYEELLSVSVEYLSQLMPVGWRDPFKIASRWAHRSLGKRLTADSLEETRRFLRNNLDLLDFDCKDNDFIFEELTPRDRRHSSASTRGPFQGKVDGDTRTRPKHPSQAPPLPQRQPIPLPAAAAAAAAAAVAGAAAAAAAAARIEPSSSHDTRVPGPEPRPMTSEPQTHQAEVHQPPSIPPRQAVSIATNTEWSGGDWSPLRQQQETEADQPNATSPHSLSPVIPFIPLSSRTLLPLDPPPPPPPLPPHSSTSPRPILSNLLSSPSLPDPLPNRMGDQLVQTEVQKDGEQHNYNPCVTNNIDEDIDSNRENTSFAPPAPRSSRARTEAEYEREEDDLSVNLFSEEEFLSVSSEHQTCHSPTTTHDSDTPTIIPTRHPRSTMKLRDWQLTIDKKIAIIGDSLLNRVPPFEGNDIQIDGYPGGTFYHARHLLRKVTVNTQPYAVILAFGFNNRSSNIKRTVIGELQQMLEEAKQAFPAAHIYVPLINSSRALPSGEQANIQLLNEHIEDNCNFLPKLADKHFQVTSDHVHWTEQTAAAMMAHWLNLLN